MVNIPVEENLDYQLGPNNRAQSTLKIEPRIPAHVLPSWNIVIRTIIPITYKPNTMATTGGSSGLGDVNPTFFLTQAHPGPVIWGVGPDFELPTATQTSLGTGQVVRRALPRLGREAETVDDRVHRQQHLVLRG